MNNRFRFVSGISLIALAAASVCSAQVVTSAHSGTVHYFEGDVSIDGTPVQQQNARFTEIKEKQALRTGRGTAPKSCSHSRSLPARRREQFHPHAG